MLRCLRMYYLISYIYNSMEKTIAWKKRKYIQMCNMLDAVTKEANFCNIQKNKCDTFKCAGKLTKTKCLCCSDCSYLDENGCTVKSLVCKLHFCYFENTSSVRRRLTKLCIDDHQLMMVDRFIRLRELCLDFITEHDIPYYEERLSMKDTFKKAKDVNGGWRTELIKLIKLINENYI